MDDIRKKAALSLISPLSGFERAKLEEFSEGHSLLTVEPDEGALNVHGIVHGGFLYTLSDISAGMISCSLGKICVTLNSSFNFIKAARSGILYFEANSMHCGRTTLTVDIKIRNQEDQLIASGTFTMYLLGDLEKDR